MTANYRPPLVGHNLHLAKTSRVYRERWGITDAELPYEGDERDGAAPKRCRGCRGCRDCLEDFSGSQDATRYEWISTARCTEDTARLLVPQLPHNLSGVCAVPRSGMLAASVIATHMHLPLWSLDGGRPRQLGHGGRGGSLVADPSGPLLVVDDTVYRGGAMSRSRDRMKGKPALFAAVYVTPQRRQAVDFHARVLHGPHLLEWNFVNNWPFIGRASHKAYRGGLALDFDGILCFDPDVPDADAGPGLDRYRQWMVDARPQWLPRMLPVPLIVTARLERWRAETEEWLRRWRVQWKQLVMHPADRASARGDVAAWKAGHFKRSACGFFAESDPRQAERIFQIAGRPVICPRAGKVHQ